MATAFALISAGKLLVCREGEAPREIDSTFARETEARREKTRKRHGWKNSEDDMRASLVWGKQAGVANDELMRVEFSAVACGPQPGEVTYAVRVGDVGGIFDGAADGTERRLGHRAGWRIEEMERHPGDGTLAYATSAEGGMMHLAVKTIAENAGREVTEGDSIDQSPSWVPGAAKKLVYQSAGVARNERGFVTSLAPFTLHELDLGTGEMTTLLEDADHDLLLPHKLADGSLVFIQRPYENPHRVSHWRAALSFLMIPVRLIQAVFGFLDFFSMRYSGKPLAQSGHTRAAQPDYKQMILWGRALEADKRAREASASEPRALAPDSWQLIQRHADGSERTLAKGVLGYDVGSDGTILYTDGRTIFRCVAGGKPEKVMEHFPVEKIAVLG